MLSILVVAKFSRSREGGDYNTQGGRGRWWDPVVLRCHFYIVGRDLERVKFRPVCMKKNAHLDGVTWPMSDITLFLKIQTTAVAQTN
jgi:hypothetical protein